MTGEAHAEPRPGWRERLVRDLEGDILEIGVGAGENLPYYRSAHHVWGIEPHTARAAQARAAAAKAMVPVTVDIAPAEKLPYADHSFDHAVSSLVFCSVDSPTDALAELERVLRPGGLLHMVEHVRPENFVFGTLARVATPLWSRIAWNCHLDRTTVDTLRAAGWRVRIEDRRFVFVQITAHPPAGAVTRAIPK